MKPAILRAAAAGLALAAAAPLLAQAAPPAGSAMTRAGPGGPGGWGRGGMMRPENAFPSMSPAGRQMMADAMRGGEDRKAEHEAVKASRDRMLDILAADRLDTGALKRAMDDERVAANAGRERHQAAMLAALTKLSVADRKAFVTDSRAMKARMEQRMEEWRGKRGMRGMGGDMPPPPPPPPGL